MALVFGGDRREVGVGDSTAGRAARLAPVRIAVLTCAVAIVLTRFAPDWPSLCQHLSRPQTWVAEAGIDQASLSLASALLWLLGCWFAVGLIFAIAGSLPGRSGRRAGAIAAQVMPKFLQRVIVSAAGVSIVLSPAAAFAQSAPTPNTASPSIVLVVPTDDGTAATDAGPAAPTDPAGPTDATASPAPTSPASSAPTSPAPAEARPATTPAQQSPATSTSLTVQPGDSLWSLANRQLGAGVTDEQIQSQWQRVYRANKEVIGADPNLIKPGQSLVLPVAQDGASK